MASIAVNGLGRIGRAALRIIVQADGADVVAVSDLIPARPGRALPVPGLSQARP